VKSDWRRRRRCVAAVAVAVLVCAAGARSHAEGARLERVMLLTVPERVSLVIELSAEPMHVETRRISSSVLEIDAGPVAGAVRSEVLAAPRGTRFVADVSIRPVAGKPGGASVRARITLIELSRSSVRVIGRRVYVDFSADEPYRPSPPRPQARIAVRRVPPAAAPPAAAPPVTLPRDAYHTAVEPAIGRLEALAPFLMSASGAPSPPVLQAVGQTLSGLNASVRSVAVPPESRRVHDALTSAIALAASAVDPSFAGDRTAQARAALSQLDRAKAALAAGS
jgi:hypothetical protein